MSSLTTELHDAFGAARAKGHVRPLDHSDVGAVRDLWIAAGGRCVPAASDLTRRFLCDSPWRDAAFPPLVYESIEGGIVGCLMMSPRPMMFRERSIRAVVAHRLIAAQSRAGTRAAVELVRQFLCGPQDLSLAVWDDFGRRLWTSLGGSVTAFHSLSWTRALMPARYVLNAWKQRGFAMALYPACEAIDAAARLFRGNSVTSQASDARSDDLDAVTMMSYLSAFASGRALRPSYDVTTLRWLFRTLEEQEDERGVLQKVAVRTASGRPLGWYVYRLRGSGAAEVLQVGGKDDALRTVVDHLFEHARKRGAVAVNGPMDARLVGALSDTHCTFHRPRNTWALIHAADTRIVEAIHSGDAFLSRLEGAAWAGFED